MRAVRLCTFSVPSTLVAAMRAGFFADAGLEVSVDRAAGSTPQLEDLLAGRHDVIHTNADNVMKYRGLRDADVMVVTVTEFGLAFDLVARPEVGGIDDLAGRVVAVDAPDSGYAFVLYELLRQAGVEPGGYEVLAAGNTDARCASLLEGAAAAAMLGHGPLRTALDAGCRVLARGAEAFPGYPGLTVATTGAALAADRQLVIDYARALRRAAIWAADAANEGELVAHMCAEHDIDAERATALIEGERRVRAAVAPHAAAIVDGLGVIEGLRADWSDSGRAGGYVDESVLREVEDGIPAP